MKMNGTILNRVRKLKSLVALVLFAALFFGSVFNSVARVIEARDLILFGGEGTAFCSSNQHASDGTPTIPSNSGHEGDCCVLCNVSSTVRIADLSIVPFDFAYQPIEKAKRPIPPDYPVPDIAALDGVFPHDIPARAPPFWMA